MTEVETATTYRVDFGDDLLGAAHRGDYFLTECINAPDSGHDPELPEQLRACEFDGERLVMTMGPEHTEDDRYSTAEVSSTRRFDQRILDDLHRSGSPRVIVPGRQAVFREVVFSPQFADGRAAADPVTTGVCMQSWHGIEEGGIDFSARPKFVIAAIAYIGGRGALPRLFARTIGDERPFVAYVVDFRSGILWSQPLRGTFDPAEPHDLAMRWLPDRDLSFTVDGREVALYRDGRVRVYPLKLRNRQFFRGTDLLGHRHISPDTMHIDVWINSSTMSSTPTVPTGRRFGQDLSVAIRGFGVEPV